MVRREEMDGFLAQRTLALVGASRSGRKFGNRALKALLKSGYRVFPIHPQAETLEGLLCYRDLGAVPEPVDGLVLVVPPAESIKLIDAAHATGVRRIWMQPGAESEAAIESCRERNILVIHGQCLLMLLDGAGGFHRFHRKIAQWTGKLPVR